MAHPVFEDIRIKLKSGNPVTRLIIINVAVFLLFGLLRILAFMSGESSAMAEFENLVKLNLSLPLSFTGLMYKPWTLVTYMFTQFGFFHIFWNMIMLYWFGEILSEYTSSRKVFPVYIMGGIAGAIFTMIVVALMKDVRLSGGILIGASASVTAIIAAAATLVPNYRMRLMFIGEVKLLYVALAVIFIDILDVASYMNIGGNLAHIGGALMGYFFMVLYKSGRDISKPFNRLADIFSSRRATMKVVSRKKVSDEEYNYSKRITQQQIDMILDKISRSGYDSLTKAEKDLLFKASKK